MLSKLDNKRFAKYYEKRLEFDDPDTVDAIYKEYSKRIKNGTWDGISDSRRIKDNTEECELWVQHDVYKEPVDPDFDWDAVDEDEISPEDYTWGVNNQYRWEKPLYVDWDWSDEELVNYLIQIGFLNRGVTASDLNIDWDGANDMIILEQASDGKPLGYIYMSSREDY